MKKSFSALFNVAAKIALLALIIWWLLPVATAGALVVGWWQAVASVTLFSLASDAAFGRIVKALENVRGERGYDGPMGMPGPTGAPGMPGRDAPHATPSDGVIHEGIIETPADRYAREKRRRFY